MTKVNECTINGVATVANPDEPLDFFGFWVLFHHGFNKVAELARDVARDNKITAKESLVNDDTEKAIQDIFSKAAKNNQVFFPYGLLPDIYDLRAVVYGYPNDLRHELFTQIYVDIQAVLAKSGYSIELTLPESLKNNCKKLAAIKKGFSEQTGLPSDPFLKITYVANSQDVAEADFTPFQNYYFNGDIHQSPFGHQLMPANDRSYGFRLRN